ncbi:MAG: SMC-Scp complex subunit ScpB [Calditrichia bacterium]|nr:SMC-Scp complex subunit ScpB [Calditrichia bacterium]
MSQSEKKVYVNILESLLFTSEAPLTVSRIREIIPELKPKEIEEAVTNLNEQYQKGGRTFEIKEIAGGYQLFTLPEYADYIDKLFQTRQKSRLTQKALETVAIIAYKQPLTKHEIEEIRGVNVDGVMKTLLSRNLITISGRAKAPGSPFLYVTTKRFLDYFGLTGLEDLPKLKEIDELIDVEDERFPHHETIFREIDLVDLGLKSNGNENEKKEESDGTKENPAE